MNNRMGRTAGALALSVMILSPNGFADDNTLPPQDAREVFVQGLAERSDRWTCTAARAFRCHADGCERIEPTVTIEINFDEAGSSYDRCDPDGCDRYQGSPHRSGLFTVVPFARGAFFKAVNDGSEFVETMTTGTIVFNRFGRCSPSQP